jgi:hypothetical protein
MNDTSITIRSGRWQIAGRDRTRVGPLEHRHAVIGAQLPGQLAVGHVDAGHLGGTALQQAVGEAARRSADVQATPPLDGHRQLLQGVLELDPAARHEPAATRDRHPRVGGDQPPGLLGELLADPHLARHHRGRGARTRREEAALGQELVEADLRCGHAGSVTV